MAQWLPVLDDAIAGVQNAVTGTAETAGDAAGGFVGGAFDGLGQWLLMLAVVVGIAVVVGGAV